MCVVDNFTDMSWLHFLKRKSDMVKFRSNLLGLLKGKGINFEHLRFDNEDKHMSK